MTEDFKAKLLMLYPEYKTVLGPYTRKDGRQHIVLNNTSKSKYESGKLKTISYPKAIMEVYLNRRLEKNETVDHIDKDYLNNDIQNLQVLDRKVHAKLDAKRVKYLPVKCTICKKEFIPTRSQFRSGRKGFFCSKKCSGLYGALRQNNKIKEADEKQVKKVYYNNKGI